MKPRLATATAWTLAGLFSAGLGCATGAVPRTAHYPSPRATLAAGSPAPNSALVRREAPAGAVAVVRGQDGPRRLAAEDDPGSNVFTRNRMPVTVAQAEQVPPPQAPEAQLPAPAPGFVQPATPWLHQPPPPGPAASGPAPLWSPPPLPDLTQPPGSQPYVPGIPPVLSAPIDVYVDETQTGRFMFGAGINSDAGVTGQIVIDERNFDITRWPTSWRDFVEGKAFRGAGQGFRMEAMPGTQVQRYLVSFTEPYLLDTPVSFNISGFLFTRRYLDWDEERLGGRVAFGYRLTPDLSVSTAIRAENVEVKRPRVLGVPELDAVLGNNDLFTGRLTLSHDTRDIPFAPTEGHLIEFSYEQAFGQFSYPRAEMDYRQYFLVRERPDGSGRHTLGYIFQLGFSGSDTPLFERYFAGGYSTLRGFDFRGASPMHPSGVRVGGDFKFLGSVEYLFPLTADDMLKGAAFVDYGTVEEDIAIRGQNFRVAPGFGLRINVPALGPAPLAFDFAFPVHKADTDDTRVFSFFFGVGK